jgi:hypothetical protein
MCVMKSAMRTVCGMALTPAFANFLLCADRHLNETLVRVPAYLYPQNLLTLT